MNSEQRRAARRKRREEKRAKAKAERVKACTLETVADLNSLCKASKQAARGVMWKSSTQRYMRSYLRNAVLSRRDLLEGRDICRGFIRFDLWERGKLRHISAVHFPERVVQKSLSQNALVPAIVPTAVVENDDDKAADSSEDFWAKDESQLKLDPPPAPPADFKPDEPDYDAFQGVKFSE